MFSGAIPALVTPFRNDPPGKPDIDFEALEGLVEWQLANGVSGFVVAGTTGEAATLDAEEKIELTRRVIGWVKGRVPVIVGTGSNNTRATVEMTRAMRELGADGALVVCPYYNKPTQEGLFRHFKSVADEGGLPVIVYNVPGRTGVDMSAETFGRLSALDNIVAAKQAVDSISKLMELVSAVDGRMDILAGNCDITWAVMAVGGKGVISTAANIIPRQMSEIVSLAEQEKMEDSLKLQCEVLPIIRALFSETNPIPVKAALAMSGKIPNDTLRLPLVPAGDATRALLRRVLNIG